MKIKFISTLLFLISLHISSAHAATTYVYCATPDGSDWDWLLTNNNDYILMEGVWGRNTYSDGTYFNYFSISIEKYTLINSMCPLGYVAQPGDRDSSFWEVFYIIDYNGNFIADGKKSVIGSNTSPSFRL
ncbi:hypothetical protein HQQ94_02955 [Shewanella sp. VB17]|uniref:hypothetical protein n=1 Tax=Shewanella sp. VB17 TaxID=2739432 RepID=UPI001565C040|nr:hypothetical protein [Shewanella sp. VB17]NRD72212.1 hypothetical protein [Shewanella sp. VB17]